MQCSHSLTSCPRRCSSWLCSPPASALAGRASRRCVSSLSRSTIRLRWRVQAQLLNFGFGVARATGRARAAGVQGVDAVGHVGVDDFQRLLNLAHGLAATLLTTQVGRWGAIGLGDGGRGGPRLPQRLDVLLGTVELRFQAADGVLKRFLLVIASRRGVVRCVLPKAPDKVGVQALVVGGKVFDSCAAPRRAPESQRRCAVHSAAVL